MRKENGNSVISGFQEQSTCRAKGFGEVKGDDGTNPDKERIGNGKLELHHNNDMKT